MVVLSRAVLKVLSVVLVISALSCASVSEKEKEAQAYFKLGVSHLISGETQAAYLKFHEAMLLDPDNKEIHNGLGNVYIQLEDYEKAAKHFLRAIDEDDEYSEAYNNLCYVYYVKKNYYKAIRNCKKALENPLYPTPDKAFYNLGRSYYRLGDYHNAIEAFNDGVRRSPNFYPAYYGLALAYNARKMYGKASEAMGYAIGFDPKFQGDKVKAEREFMNLQAGGEAENLEDLSDFIEILHY